MKNYLSICTTVAVFLLASCSNFLDTVPPNNITNANFPRNEADVKRAVDAAYAGMKSWNVDIYFYMSELRTNNFSTSYSDAQRDWSDISNYIAGPNLTTFRNVWANLYQIINRSNEVLERIDGVPFSDETLRVRYKAEVRFLRAFSYFQLVRLFNRVPLIDRVITPEEGIQIGQSEPDHIYAFITSEISAIAGDLPPAYEASDLGRVTRWAAKGILANVYITMAGFPLNQTERLNDAKPLLEEIIAQEGTYVTFAPTYGEMFTYVNDNKYFMLEAQYISGGVSAGNSLPAQVYPQNLSRDSAMFAPLIWSARLTIPQGVMDSYETADRRFEASIDTSYYTNGEPPQVGNTPYYSKFMDTGLTLVDYNDWPINFPLLRYEDVLLMYAEVLNEQAGTPPQEAVDILNRIRSRANLGNIQPVTKEAFNDAMQLERRHEFAFEGQYWFYLVRTGRAVPTMNAFFETIGRDTRIDENDLIYPIPESQMTIYPGLYTQNVGYN